MKHLTIPACVMIVLPYVSVFVSFAGALPEANRAIPLSDITVTNTPTTVRAASGGRIALSCTNTSASVSVRWGDASVTATKGQQLKPGASIEINNLSEVYMVSEGANVTVACTEEMR